MRLALASIHPRPLSGQIEGLVGLAQALTARGHSVEVVSAFPSHTLLSAQRFELARQSHRVLLDQPARMTRILARLVRVARDVDLIQLNLPTPAFALYADLLQMLVRVPVLVGYEAHLLDARAVLRRDRLGAAPDFYLARLLINNALVARLTLCHAAGYVVHTRYQRAELHALGYAPPRVHVLAPVLPPDKLERVPRESARTRLAPGRLVTFLGHYNHVKGVDVLLRAFRQVAARVPDARLVLAWSGIGSNRGVERALAQDALADRVICLEGVRVPELLSASDLVVLPYRLTIGQAAFPATLLEVYAANVPLVTSDLPLLREVTNEGQLALLTPPEDADALAVAIERALNDSALGARMAQAQHAWMQAMTPARVVQAYERLYERIGAHQA